MGLQPLPDWFRASRSAEFSRSCDVLLPTGLTVLRRIHSLRATAHRRAPKPTPSMFREQYCSSVLGKSLQNQLLLREFEVSMLEDP